jgi:hypothetical protein
MEQDTQTQLQREAAHLIAEEKTSWEAGVAFVTDRVAFQIRPLIRTVRKLYWGIFDEPTDPTTGQDKVFIPLIESTVEAVVKNIDLDTKDINFRAKHPGAYGLTAIVRSCVRNALEQIRFGEKLDDLGRTLAIDGTAVWYTGESMDGKKLEVHKVDLLNFYIDPTADSIQETDAVIERIILTEDQFKQLAKKEGWVNYENVVGTANLARNDAEFGMNFGFTGSSVRYVEVFRRYGKTPKHLITGDMKDKDEYVDAELIASGGSKAWVFHAGKKLKNSKKPYEEAWYTRVPGRWYGRGVAEKLMMLQIWLNTIVNIRINRARVSQLGIFKIRRGSGITPQMISRLASNGAILVNNIDDIEQFVMQEASQASYNDENIIKDWAQRVTAAYEVVTGEQLPSSTTATAIGIQSQTAQSQFVLIKEGIGMFLERWLTNQAIPVIQKNLKKSDIIRVTGNADLLRDYDEKIANYLVYQEVDRIQRAGGYVDPAQVELERQRVISQIASLGKERYVQAEESIDFMEYDVDVYVTNEDFDKGSMLSNLINMLQITAATPQLGVDPGAIIRQALDLMGLDSVQLRQQNYQQGAIPGVSPQPQGGLATFSASNTQGNPQKLGVGNGANR